MKFYKLILILIVFFKTETLFSENNLFNVDNIQLEKNDKITNKAISDLAIKKGFQKLITKILLKEDINKLSDLNFLSIKQLVTYYQRKNTLNSKNNIELVNFNISFDKDKIHDLFYKRGILYSEISDKELYVLPILVKENEIFIFNNNYFYKNWNKAYNNDSFDLIDFILPLENIEIIKKINDNRDSLISLNIIELFQEYSNKNLALILIEDSETSNEKIYINTIIQDKKISKSLDLKKQNLSSFEFYEKIITETKKELINLVKSNNLIDIRTPSFLNMRLKIYNKSNLVEIKKKMKKIQSIENIYVQEFNKDNMNLRIKYLGKLDKLINALKKENINLQLINDQWIIKTL
ncbi:hypothetical protein N9V55_01805 [Candidatus Pelagibacter bacterium]|nr:hypothetical protein [Candidatus Pelagibacter bacterium]MDC0447661.1 hypothetical protein [Pelagibacteraceae bacterium]